MGAVGVVDKCILGSNHTGGFSLTWMFFAMVDILLVVPFIEESG